MATAAPGRRPKTFSPSNTSRTNIHARTARRLEEMPPAIRRQKAEGRRQRAVKSEPPSELATAFCDRGRYGNSMIALEGVSVQAGAFALTGLSFEVGTGEYAVLMGRTG